MKTNNNKFRTKRYSLISMGVCVLCIIYLLVINFRLASEYAKATSKTRALFGLNEIVYIQPKVYVELISIVALILALIGLRKKESKNYVIVSILLAILSGALVFPRLWRLLV